MPRTDWCSQASIFSIRWTLVSAFHSESASARPSAVCVRYLMRSIFSRTSTAVAFFSGYSARIFLMSVFICAISGAVGGMAGESEVSRSSSSRLSAVMAQASSTVTIWIFLQKVSASAVNIGPP